MNWKEQVGKWWALPAIIVGGFSSIGMIITFFGFSLRTPASNIVDVTDKLGVHIVEERVYHDAQKVTDMKHEAQFDSLMKSINTLVQHQRHMEDLQEKVLRGECLENSRDQLVLQGLIQECRRLGIER